MKSIHFCAIGFSSYVLRMSDIVITSAKRTAYWKVFGLLSGFSAPELGKFSVEGVLEQNKIPKDMIDEVIMGQVLTGGSGQNPARQCSILSNST